MNNQLDNNEEEIDLVEIVRVLKSKILILIAAVIMGALLLGLYSMFLVTPKYESTSMIYILTSEPLAGLSLSDLQMGSSLAGDYEEMIYSRPVLEEVVDNLNLDMDYKKLKNLIQVTNKDNTRMLRITVIYTDPTMAMQIANEVAEVSRRQIEKVMDTEMPRIVEPAVVSNDKVSPNNARNAVIGGILGLLIAAGVIIVRFMMDNTLTSPEDVEKYLGLNTLASVPYEGGMDDGEKKKKKRRWSGIKRAS